MSPRFPALLVAMIAMHAPAIRAADDADPTQSAIQAARRAAGEAGIELPEINDEDISKLLRKVSDEVSKASKKQDEKKSAEPVTEGPGEALEALPAWIPALPGFTSKDGAKIWPGKTAAVGKIKGTSTATPASIADAWSSVDGKGFSMDRNSRTKDQKTTEKVRLDSTTVDGQWVELTATKSEGKATTVRVTFVQPNVQKAPVPIPLPSTPIKEEDEE